MILYPKGLTCRELSNHGNIWVQSLTSALMTLLGNEEISIVGLKKSSVSNRMVQIYGFSESQIADFHAKNDAI